MPPALFHDPVDDSKTQAGTFSNFFRGVERLEHPFLNFGRHAGTGVCDLQRHVCSARSGKGLHVELGVDPDARGFYE